MLVAGQGKSVGKSYSTKNNIQSGTEFSFQALRLQLLKATDKH